MVNNYISKQGDIVFIDSNPTKGHEQSGKRPAIALSKYLINSYTNMVLFCPITSSTKDFPTHYKLEDTKLISVS